MRRALPALLATIGGLALLASFHTTATVKAGASAVPTTATAPPSGGTPPPSGTSASTTVPAAGGKRTGQFDGPAIPTQFGDVQVRVILKNGRITDVQGLQMPFDHQRSAEISQQAQPLLHDEVLQAQSAQINLLSGATYTSDAYQRSLQAALDQLR
jgi:uncharacterized protein with FMN-binding domain